MSNNQNEIMLTPLQQVYGAILEISDKKLEEPDLNRIFANAFWAFNSAQASVMPEKPAIPFNKIPLDLLLNDDGSLKPETEIFELFRDFFLDFFLSLGQKTLEKTVKDSQSITLQKADLCEAVKKNMDRFIKELSESEFCEIDEGQAVALFLNVLFAAEAVMQETTKNSHLDGLPLKTTKADKKLASGDYFFHFLVDHFRQKAKSEGGEYN